MILLDGGEVAEVEAVDVVPDAGAEREELPVAVVRVLVEVAGADGEEPRGAVPVFEAGADLHLLETAVAPCGEERLREIVRRHVLDRLTRRIDDRGMTADEEAREIDDDRKIVELGPDDLPRKREAEVRRERIGLGRVDVRQLRAEVRKIEADAEAVVEQPVRLPERRDVEAHRR